MSDKLKAVIQLKGTSKEYTLEIENKSNFLEEIKIAIKENDIFEFSDDEGEYAIIGASISSIEFINPEGEKKAGF
ncbi:MAG: hypothetical protein EVA28_01965 [Candidatus Actinomarinales bacterium]|nr:MAG: hypothetical protein EVA28_01965 [Candidatus Actinomarinales bacterium]|tara:strand:- start:651 stop:875 length:225 start_codon:yes stop_codon:yes gene_type:complete